MVEQFRGGWTPETLTLSLVIGAVVGVFPLFGAAAVVCLFISLRFRLNLPAIQAANFAVYPLQFALFAVWLRAGETLFGLSPVPFSPGRLANMLSRDWGEALSLFGGSSLAGLAVWALAAPPAAWCLYRLTLPITRRLTASYRLGAGGTVAGLGGALRQNPPSPKQPQPHLSQPSKDEASQRAQKSIAAR